MKKVIRVTAFSLAIWILGLSFSTAVHAGIVTESTAYSDIFEVDEASLIDEFSSLNTLESSIIENNISDLESLKANNPELLTDLGISQLKEVNSANATQGFTFDDIDWGAFAWGFCCCPIGFFVVAVNGNKTSDQKASFWIGFGVSVVLNMVYGAAYGFNTDFTF